MSDGKFGENTLSDVPIPVYVGESTHQQNYSAMLHWRKRGQIRSCSRRHYPDHAAVHGRGRSVGPCNAPKFLAFKSAFFHLVNFGPGEKKRRREGVDSVDRVSACVWQSCNSSHKGEIVSVPPSSFLLSAVMGVGATLLQSGPVAPRPLALSVASVGRSDSDYAEL